mmetsp:Transcript_25675/g.46379  ORF Transcript_25675/g.46379 Transcript_25675/m.46379 type:complete len:226 (-) Transcript_25675:1304-1981(-)
MQIALLAAGITELILNPMTIDFAWPSNQVITVSQTRTIAKNVNRGMSLSCQKQNDVMPASQVQLLRLYTISVFRVRKVLFKTLLVVQCALDAIHCFTMGKGLPVKALTGIVYDKVNHRPRLPLLRPRLLLQCLLRNRPHPFLHRDQLFWSTILYHRHWLRTKESAMMVNTSFMDYVINVPISPSQLLSLWLHSLFQAVWLATIFCRLRKESPMSFSSLNILKTCI